MSKTPFSKKCEVLGMFWLLYRDDDSKEDAWFEFFAFADVGLPLAYMVWQDLATPKKESKTFIDEAWAVYCELLGIDANARWESMEDTFVASPSYVASEG